MRASVVSATHDQGGVHGSRTPMVGASVGAASGDVVTGVHTLNLRTGLDRSTSFNQRSRKPGALQHCALAREGSALLQGQRIEANRLGISVANVCFRT
jgi:hypothetical protein